MNLQELTARLELRNRPQRAASTPGLRGRKNTSTGQRGISKKMEKNGRYVYCVFTNTTPAIYIGRAKTLEQAEQMQADFVPNAEPADCTKIRGVRWVHSAYRASVTIRGQLFRKQGFKTPEEAKAWRDQIIADNE